MLLYLLIGIVSLVVLGFLIFLNSGEKLPKDSSAIISKVISSPLPELVTGESESGLGVILLSNSFGKKTLYLKGSIYKIIHSEADKLIEQYHFRYLSFSPSPDCIIGIHFSSRLFLVSSFLASPIYSV